VLARRLGDRVKLWITHNEPFVTAFAGYLMGNHAPGLNDPLAAGRAIHTLLLSHGYAVEALRANTPAGTQVGITLNLAPVHPATGSEEDRLAAWRYDGASNRLFLDPILRGCYPEDVAAVLSAMMPEILPGDMETISTPLDFLGANYYSRAVVRHDPAFPFIEASPLQPEGNEYSQMWEIYPPGIYELLKRLWEDYQVKNIIVTENGVPVPDGIDFDGRVRDQRRVRYLRDHLAQVHRALSEGIPVGGYMVWSLLDNFEWALGYQMRFGLIHVDFQTLRRTIKDSGRWYAQVIQENGLHLTGSNPYLPC